MKCSDVLERSESESTMLLLLFCCWSCWDGACRWSVALPFALDIFSLLISSLFDPIISIFGFGLKFASAALPCNTSILVSNENCNIRKWCLLLSGEEIDPSGCLTVSRHNTNDGHHFRNVTFFLTSRTRSGSLAGLRFPRWSGRRKTYKVRVCLCCS